MALTSPLQPWYIKKFVGMNARIEPNDLSVEHSVLTQNGRFEVEPGALSKRSPLYYYNADSMGASPVHSSFRWHNGDKIVQMAACGSKMYVGDDSTGTMTEIRAGLTDGRYFNFVVYKSLCIAGNGYDNNFVYDGASDNVTWEHGACKAVKSAGGSNLDSAADYYYAVTFDDDALVTGAVSNTVTTNADNRKVTLTHIPQAPSGADNIKLYRTEGGGSSLKLLDTFTGGAWTTSGGADSTTYTDDIADGSLGAAMPAVTDAPFKGNLLQMHRERLFVAGNPDEPNKIVYSEPYLSHYIQHITNSRFMEISKDDGDVIQGIPISLGVMLCVKRNSFRKLHITTPTSGASPDSWYADDPIQYVGAIAPRTILQTPYGIFFLNRDGWYLWDGAKAQPVIDEFNPDDILGLDFSNCVAHFFNTTDGLILCSYADSSLGQSVKNRQMVYNWKRQAMAQDHIGVASYSSYSGADTNDLIYGDSSAGFLYYGDAADIIIAYSKKSSIEAIATHETTETKGTEDDPYIVVGRGETIDEMVGTIDEQVGTIDIKLTDGTITFDAVQLNVGRFGKFSWNLLKFHDDDVVIAYMRSGASKVACEAADWGTGMTDGTGSAITATGNTWVQWKFVFDLNSTAGSARIYKNGGYVFKFTYSKSAGSVAEASVEFIHKVGFRNFDSPDVEKIFKKIVSNYSGTGTFQIQWETENASGSFTIDMAANPEKWGSFFPSSAFGTEINITIYKNDLGDFKIKELKGFYTPEPIIV